MSLPKIGILGYAGSIGSRHGKNLMYLGHQVVGFDPAVKGKHTREEVIGMSDAVIICTPTREHWNDIMDCHGKNVLVEKPIAFDAPAPMIRGFCHGKSSKGQFIAVGNNLRFHRCVIDTKKMLEQGIIGDIGWAEFTVLQKTEKEPYLMDGVSRNWGAHEIDLALYLLGPGQATEIIDCKKEYHVGSDTETDVAMKFAMKHESGAYSTIDMDYLTEPEKRGYKLVGNKGVIEVDLVARTVKVSSLAISNIIQKKDTWDSNYMDEMKCFISCLGIDGIPNSIPLASGLEAAEVMDVILSVRSMAGLIDK
jgi:predicted dehydrogenase